MPSEPSRLGAGGQPVAAVVTEVRERLLERAVVHFGRRGFERASTRAIASDAGTGMSAISFHFAGKEGLYLACAERIAAGIRAEMGCLLDRIDAETPIGREEAASAIAALLTVYSRMMIDPAREGWAPFVSREEAFPTEAFERLHEGASRRLAEKLVELVGIVVPELSPREVAALAFSLWGSSVFLLAGGATVSRLLESDHLDDEAVELLIDRIGAMARSVLLDRRRHLSEDAGEDRDPPPSLLPKDRNR